MKKDKENNVRDLLFFSSIGLQMAFSVVIGYGIGYWLDTKMFDTYPWLTLVFFVMGVIAGFRNIGLAIKRIRRY